MVTIPLDIDKAAYYDTMEIAKQHIISKGKEKFVLFKVTTSRTISSYNKSLLEDIQLDPKLEYYSCKLACTHYGKFRERDVERETR